MHHLYSPASGTHSSTLLAREDLALVTVASPERIAVFWEAVSGGADAAALLDALTAGGISSTPPFALVSGLGSPRSVVMSRGAMTVTVTGSDGRQTFDGSSVSSWVEATVASVSGMRIETGHSDPVTLPLVRGVVGCTNVSWGSVEAETSAPAKPGESDLSTPGLPDPVSQKKAAVPKKTASQRKAASEGSSVVSDATLAPPTTTIVPPPSPPEPAGYDHLFGATVMRHVEDAAVRLDENGEEAVAETAADATGGDFLDRTVVVDDIAALRAKRRAERGREKVISAGPQYFVELPSGVREMLDQPLIVGRAPTATRVAGSTVPRLITITTPNQDISRSHVQIAVEGDSVIVTDLHSMNGTTVTVPGKNTVRLRDGEPTTVITGTVIDLGDGATLTVGQN